MFLAAGSRSIYIRGLPLNAEVTQVVKEFKKFGPIKPGGVLVRSNKVFLTETYATIYQLCILGGMIHCFNYQLVSNALAVSTFG